MKNWIVIGFLAGSNVLAADSFPLSIDEFKMYQQYKNAMADERVLKMKPEARLPAIAKDAGFKLKELKQVVEKGDAAGDLKALCETAIAEELAKTELNGRVKKVEVDTSQPHAVAYVMWLNEEAMLLDIEASFAAFSAQKGCPIVSTVQVWSQTGMDPKTRVFEALISGTAAANIRPEKVKDFATTRYIRLFEKLKSVNKGDDFSTVSAKGVE